MVTVKLPTPHTIVYASAANTPSVKAGCELGGYEKERLYSEAQMIEAYAVIEGLEDQVKQLRAELERVTGCAL